MELFLPINVGTTRCVQVNLVQPIYPWKQTPGAARPGTGLTDNPLLTPIWAVPLTCHIKLWNSDRFCSEGYILARFGGKCSHSE